MIAPRENTPEYFKRILVDACQRVGLHVKKARVDSHATSGAKLVMIDAYLPTRQIRNEVSLICVLHADARWPRSVQLHAGAGEGESTGFLKYMKHGRNLVAIDSLDVELQETVNELDSVAKRLLDGEEGPFRFAETEWVNWFDFEQRATDE